MMARGPSDADQVHNRIAVLRTERGLSRRELSEAVDVHYRTIGYLERGEYSPSLALAFRIARVFEMPLDAVFSDRAFTPLSEQVYGQRPQGAGHEGAHQAT